MANAKYLLTEHLDTWSSTVKTQSSAGRGGGNKRELYGVKKLRELILGLAVRGLLVPQDSNDEPASESLKRIVSQRLQLAKDGKIKKQKNLAPLTQIEEPFSIPANWEWIRLGNATNYGICDKAEAADVDEDTWVLEMEDVEKSTSKLLKKVRFSDRIFRSSKNRFTQSDVIYGKLRPYLDKVLIADEPGVCTTEMIPIRAYSSLAPAFLRLSLKSPYFIRYANDSTHGMNLPRMGTDKARSAPIPLPPETEQHRIVAKVDELMALCDELEQQVEHSLETHQTLVKTLLDALTTACEQGYFDEAWKRMEENFDTLFITESSIEELRRTILQLAVMGKIVPQDSAEEPASKLVNQLTAEKAALIDFGRIRKAKDLPVVSNEEIPFCLPTTWSWQRLQHITSVLGDGIHGTPEYDPNGQYYFINGSNLKDGKIEIKPDTKRVSSKEYEVHKKPLEETTVLVSINGTIGNVAFYDNEKVMLGKSACYFNLLGSISLSYIKRFIQTGYFLKYAFHNATGSTIKNVSLATMRRLPVPLPPLSEQYRIVAKVDELMTLCDRLKTSLKTCQETQLLLSDCLVDKAIN